MNLLMDPIENNDGVTPNKAGLIGFIFSLVSILGCGLLSVVGFIISLVGIWKKRRLRRRISTFSLVHGKKTP